MQRFSITLLSASRSLVIYVIPIATAAGRIRAARMCLYVCM